MKQLELKLFDVAKLVIVATDATRHTLRYAVIQYRQLVEFTCFSLTDTQHRHAQIVKYMLAVKFESRLQNTGIKLDRYDYVLIYRPRRELVLADTLSLVPLGSKPSFWCEYANVLYAESITRCCRQGLHRLTT